MFGAWVTRARSGGWEVDGKRRRLFAKVNRGCLFIFVGPLCLTIGRCE